MGGYFEDALNAEDVTDAIRAALRDAFDRQILGGTDGPGPRGLLDGDGQPVLKHASYVPVSAEFFADLYGSTRPLPPINRWERAKCQIVESIWRARYALASRLACYDITED